ncbi:MULTISPECIES: glycosyltransferase family 9 protein [unclassified Campylobacter]|uniref:glycosyltransferase family 9 protein n=1 Tax=unclassified Campylobacter TaxID=2593542 RepID=UPI001BD97DE0|nr:MULTISPECIES: glycosyltransferase family 9 protein [unclassified Campylobacter]MBT0880106.1 glycosyltransferase family 9 protein [Campylobacter sp. 2018MI27]MBT0883807.1 glycosyltransferase family 9 protein [Campylobacter sp. 2018MI10]
MKIFIYLPNWLGDAIMAAGAINALIKKYPNAKITFYGSFVACELYKDLGKIVVEIKKQRLKQIKALKEEFDLGISFKASLSSKFLLFILNAKKKFYFKANKSDNTHQVLKYFNLIKPLGLDEQLNTALPFKKLKTRKLIGIAAGANYGAAKCYEPSYFAKIASTFKEHKIILFGTKNEAGICNFIEDELKKYDIKAINLCGKTNIKRLALAVSSLDYLLANDSGIMHLGASFNIKVLAFFGPTNTKQTYPFCDNGKLFSLFLPCSPCAKKVCPLKHHNCMKQMTPEFVLEQMR